MPRVLQNISKHKSIAVQTINDLVKEKRKEYITDLPGQEYLYRSKFNEAKLFKKSKNKSETPILSEELGITANSIDEIANLVIEQHEKCNSAILFTEKIRLKTIRDIHNSRNIKEIQSIVNHFKNTLVNFTEGK